MPDKLTAHSAEASPPTSALLQPQITPAGSTMSSVRATMNQVRRWALPYFWSEDRWAARGLLAAVIGMELASVGITVLLNTWNARFYNALQQHDTAAFGRELLVFSLLAGSFIVLAVYQLYLSQWLQIRWRQWLTERFLGA